MASNSTVNYHLPQWEASDPFSRTEFNSAFAAVDTAVKAVADSALNAGNCCIETGSWVGNGYNSRSFTLPHAPKLLVIFGQYSDLTLLGLLTQEKGYVFIGNSLQDAGSSCCLSGSTLSVASDVYFNENNKTMRYVSFW